MTIATRIKHLRKNVLHLTQEDFASCIKISRSNLGNIEVEKISVTDRVIADICAAFNVSESWLRTGQGEMFIKLSRDEEIAAFVGEVLSEEADTFKKRLISVLSKLDESDWESLEKLLGALAGSTKKED